MRPPGGRDYSVRGVYREIVPPSLLVFTCGLENEEPSHDARGPERKRAWLQHLAIDKAEFLGYQGTGRLRRAHAKARGMRYRS
jgi:uncharacterized protein YndB with AHSA1/START domain